MNAKQPSSVALAILIAAMAVGCSDKPNPPPETPSPVASPTCADLDKVQDPAQRAELLKKCPRQGQFKPSEKKAW
ncbi:MAG: entry exclusion lipoprotein TrbK [Candidatus Dechloromonas phosphoritropha]|jgi:entry exclusion lipoprotein TrbK|nr:entry exclusion lipoprotein TrbK [Candidatus Dechloromonas phosphoritropha]